MVLVQIRFRSLQTTCQARRWHLGIEIAEIVKTIGAIHKCNECLANYIRFFSQYWTSDEAYLIWCKTEQRIRRWEVSIIIQCFVHHHHAIERDDFTFIRKLDQGALCMSDPWGPLELALEPNSVSSINCPLSSFYFCAHSSLSLDELRQV